MAQEEEPWLWRAPETFVRGNPVGVAADVYAFGCLVYLITAGSAPFNGVNPAEKARAARGSGNVCHWYSGDVATSSQHLQRFLNKFVRMWDIVFFSIVLLLLTRRVMRKSDSWRRSTKGWRVTPKRVPPFETHLLKTTIHSKRRCYYLPGVASRKSVGRGSRGPMPGT